MEKAKQIAQAIEAIKVQTSIQVHRNELMAERCLPIIKLRDAKQLVRRVGFISDR